MKLRTARPLVLATAALLVGPLLVTGPAGALPGTNDPASTGSTSTGQGSPGPSTGGVGEIGRGAPVDEVTAVQEPGVWSVEAEGPQSWQVTWSGSQVLPLTADRPTVVGPDGEAQAGEVVDQGRGVSVQVTAEQEPDPDDYDVHLSGRVLDARAGTLVRPRVAAVPGKLPAPSRLLAQDPAAKGPYATASSDYTLPSVPFGRYPSPIEMVGHVVQPAPGATTGPRPLVVFLHGRHSVCYGRGGDEGDWPCLSPQKEIPSHLGYDYLQQRLASQGYATVSIRVNGINAQDYLDLDGGAAARAMVVRKHLDHWRTRAAADRVDLTRVVLVGHSRGGEGVNRASIQIPADAPYRIVGQVLLAPTDFASQTAPYVPTVTLLPSCDGDVSDLQGQKFTDVARDLNADDTSLKSSVMVVGANHNFYNTEWTPRISRAPSSDDWYGPPGKACGSKDPNRLKPGAQRATGLAVVTGAVRLFADNQTQFAPMFTGQDVRVASTGASVLRSHALGGGRTVLRPGRELASVTGAGATMCLGVVREDSGRGNACAKVSSESAPHWYATGDQGPTPRRAVRFAWASRGAVATMPLSSPIDLTRDRLALRMVVDQAVPSVALRVRVTDGTGASAVLATDDGATLRRFPGGALAGKWWAQTVIVRPQGAAGVDLADIRSIGLISDSARGSIVLLDAASAPAVLAAVPGKRPVRLSIGKVRRPEGNGSPVVTLDLPVRLSGVAPAGSAVRVHVSGPRGRTRVSVVTLPTGRQVVPVRVRYRSDRAWGGNQFLSVALVPERGVVTDAYQGELVIVEDDPRPRVTVKAVRAVVKEGKPVRIRISASAPFSESVRVLGRLRSTRGAQLRISDVDPRAFAAYRRGGDRTLAGARASFRLKLPAGRRSAVFTLPTRVDGRAEGVERADVTIEPNSWPRPGIKDHRFRIAVRD